MPQWRALTPELLVMAAGVGSRYGGLKQVDPIGPGGELLMDYAVFDAARAGVARVVFVIRRESEAAFHERIGSRYARRIEVAYAYQELDTLPAGFSVPAGRTKPWGTAHAVLAATATVRGPFLAINADDFYGADAVAKAVAFLGRPPAGPKLACGLVAYALRQTLSEHGSVSRAVCRVDAEGRLLGLREYTAIEKDGDGAWDRATDTRFEGHEPVSLNLWAFPHALLDGFAAGFAQFLREQGTSPAAEYYVPAAVDHLVREGRAEVTVLRTSSRWFGVTYRDDKPLVAKRLAELTAAGEYPSPLWRD